MYGFPPDFKENFGKSRKSSSMQQKCYRESIAGKIVSSAPPEVSHVLRKNRKTRKRRPAVCWTPTRISSRIGIWLMGCLNRNSESSLDRNLYWLGRSREDLGSYKRTLS
ncbi:hypothetical protein JTE90_016533 [Oedothorax gibbosus]|uniref:Uncharacterized protein n=1 Tax=Oedothorax gibbosus TaxID=931172 RepID=A0AAV6UW25_9ARAC|nr:hypothetical protein JTE90_016533 [Oedothorax gibbosus]